MQEIIDKLELHSLRNRHWAAFETCATTGDGLYEVRSSVENTENS